jgi:hypothetical protein
MPPAGRLAAGARPDGLAPRAAARPRRSTARDAATPATSAHVDDPTPATVKGVAATRKATSAPSRTGPSRDLTRESWKGPSNASPHTTATKLGGRAPTRATTGPAAAAIASAPAEEMTLARQRPSAGPASGPPTIALVARATLAWCPPIRALTVELIPTATETDRTGGR